jgi:hypothetical protein
MERPVPDDSYNEIWGTYSVRDHEAPRAFVADVLLYDKLVIPVPPADDPDQAEFWEDFDPDRQKRMVDILGEADLVKPVEWTQWRRDMWQDEWKKSRSAVAEQARKDLAFEITAMLLKHEEVPRHAQGMVAVSNFHSLAELEEELAIEPRVDADPIPGRHVSAIVGRELLVPEADGVDDFDLLEEAVAVAGRSDYREARRDLHDRLRRFVDKDDKTDIESVRAAVRDMNKIVAEMRAMRRKKKLWNGTRRALFFAQLALSIPFAAIPMLAVGNAAIALGTYTVTERLVALDDDKRASTAAMLLDARSGFDLSKR